MKAPLLVDVDKCKRIIEMIQSADFITVNGSDFIQEPDVGTAEVVGNGENEVLNITWLGDDSEACNEILTEDCLTRAEVDGHTIRIEDGDDLEIKLHTSVPTDAYLALVKAAGNAAEFLELYRENSEIAESAVSVHEVLKASLKGTGIKEFQ